MEDSRDGKNEKNEYEVARVSGPVLSPDFFLGKSSIAGRKYDRWNQDFDSYWAEHPQLGKKQSDLEAGIVGYGSVRCGYGRQPS